MIALHRLIQPTNNALPNSKSRCQGIRAVFFFKDISSLAATICWKFHFFPPPKSRFVADVHLFRVLAQSHRENVSARSIHVNILCCCFHPIRSKRAKPSSTSSLEKLPAFNSASLFLLSR